MYGCGCGSEVSWLVKLRLRLQQRLLVPVWLQRPTCWVMERLLPPNLLTVE